MHQPSTAEPSSSNPPQADEEEQEPARVVAPDLGAQLLEDGAAHVDLPPSFDHLLTRGGSGSASARRLAARKSRLSIIAAVIVRRLTIEPARGRQVEPV